MKSGAREGGNGGGREINREMEIRREEGEI